MLAPFLIMLREGLEAALLTSIIAGYLHKTGRSSYMPAVWIGIFLAIALSFLAGAALQLISAEFPQKAQELFEAVVGLIAVVVLMMMVLWMKKAARSLRDEMQHSIDQALASKSGGLSATWALIGMVFFAVAREGLESVFFLLAIFQQSEGYAAPLGAFLGVVVAVLMGFLIYHGGLKLNLRVFFRWTGILIIFVAAGLLSSAMRNLHEAGLWNHLQAPAWDLSQTLPLSTPLGTLLSGLLGYHETPAMGEVLAYGLFLIVALTIYLKPAPSMPTKILQN